MYKEGKEAIGKQSSPLVIIPQVLEYSTLKIALT